MVQVSANSKTNGHHVRKKRSWKKKAFIKTENNSNNNHLITEYFPRTKRISSKDLVLIQEKLIRRYVANENDPDFMAVVDIDNKGKGVVALNNISKGSFICEYAGDLINLEEAKKREGQYELEDVGCYMYYFDWNNNHWCVDATKPTGRFGRLINHSRRSPNCKTKIFVHENKPHLIFIALRDIEPKEEILYDYGERDRTTIKSHPWLSRS